MVHGVLRGLACLWGGGSRDGTARARGRGGERRKRGMGVRGWTRDSQCNMCYLCKKREKGCVHYLSTEGTSHVLYQKNRTLPSTTQTVHPLRLGDATVSKNGDWRVNATSNF